MLWSSDADAKCYQMQEVSGERGGYLHGRGALDSDDLLYLKEQMEAEEDAERLLRRTEKRAFAAFKKAASKADSSPASVPLPLRVEPKPKSGIRQQDLLKKLVEVKPKRTRVSSPSTKDHSSQVSSDPVSSNAKADTDGQDMSKCILSISNKAEGEICPSPKVDHDKKASTLSRSKEAGDESKDENPVKRLLGLAYASSDDED
ncbi:uncharacterized protein LOC119987517 isoform X2 [Tripterygium wilfordii]|uniref:uncharacterized protein LOC119987517 isoform X2 n=1 Tax=Tripterygium wilfordii TaxID=458696 RepID=UPI0018F852B7|nr:uncharacterized protein LOC119987517 isoform X2 [Tripterygium wilfordii]